MKKTKIFVEIVQIGKIVQIVEIVHKIPPIFGATYTKLQAEDKKVFNPG